MGKPILSVPLPEVRALRPKHVFYYRDKASFAQKANVLLSDQELQTRLGPYARNFAKDFDYSELALKCEEILRQAAAAKRAS